MNREQLEEALKLYEERQSDNSSGLSATTEAAAVGTPSSSPTTASTSAKPKAKKRSKDTATAEDEALQMLSDAKVSEGAAKRMLSARTKKRKEIQKQVKDIKQEVANAKKLLAEAQQRLADESEKLASAKSKENTAKKTLSMATKNREDIEGEIKPTMEPKSLFKDDGVVVSASLKKGEEDTDDDKKTKWEDTDDDDNKKMAAVVTPPKKKRKKKMTKILPLSDEEKEIIDNKIDDSSTYLIKFEEYLNNVDAAGELSKQNKRSVLRQVNKLVGGEGIRYDSKTEDCWPQGCYFLKGVKVGPTDDISTLMDDAKACEEQWGRDRGNGWLLRHPLGKMAAFQQYLLQD